ncbi:BlaI/MecI/CopY family transcriptional regulator [Luteolibacter sp. AS25]|uniref:BlaI/MecI/CopY family transcriptional regulator n=1 Tax=Luteolibacter sp. AS25 TaxID=3135776 RepID=UPI00398ACD5F
MAEHVHPSNLELQALSVLWHEGPSTVSVVLESLPDGKARAYTTVLSVLQSLERKNLVKCTRAGRAHVYEPSCPKKEVIVKATRDYILNTFGGRLGEAVLATLSAGVLLPDEILNTERELQRHKNMAAKKSAKKSAAKTAKKLSKKVAAKKASTKKVSKKAAKKAPSKKVAEKKTAAKKPVKKAAKVAKKAVKKVTKSAPKKVAKKAVVKKVSKKSPKKKEDKKAPKKKSKK